MTASPAYSSTCGLDSSVALHNVEDRMHGAGDVPPTRAMNRWVLAS